MLVQEFLNSLYQDDFCKTFTENKVKVKGLKKAHIPELEKTYLNLAVQNRFNSIVILNEVCEKNKIKLNLGVNLGQALTLACQNGNDNFIRWLFEKCPDINIQTNNPFYIASINNKTETLITLYNILSKLKKINLNTDENHKVFHTICKKNLIEVAKWFESMVKEYSFTSVKNKIISYSIGNEIFICSNVNNRLDIIQEELEYNIEQGISDEEIKSKIKNLNPINFVNKNSLNEKDKNKLYKIFKKVNEKDSFYENEQLNKNKITNVLYEQLLTKENSWRKMDKLRNIIDMYKMKIDKLKDDKFKKTNSLRYLELYLEVKDTNKYLNFIDIEELESPESFLKRILNEDKENLDKIYYTLNDLSKLEKNQGDNVYLKVCYQYILNNNREFFIDSKIIETDDVIFNTGLYYNILKLRYSKPEKQTESDLFLSAKFWVENDYETRISHSDSDIDDIFKEFHEITTKNLKIKGIESNDFINQYFEKRFIFNLDKLE